MLKPLITIQSQILLLAHFVPNATISYFLSNIIISLIVTVNIFRTVEMKSLRIQIALPSFFTKETNNVFVRIIRK